MGVEFDTLSELTLDGSSSYVWQLPDELGFYGQTFVATSSDLTKIEFAIDPNAYTVEGGFISMTVMVCSVRYDGNGIHPDEVLYESALLTIAPDADGMWTIVSVDIDGLELVEGEKYAILFNANAGDGNGNSYLKFATNPQDDEGEFIYNHDSNPDNATVFAGDWSEESNPPGAWGDIAIRLTYESANVIEGTPGDDRGETALIGTSGEDIINGYEGNDELIALGDDDVLNGGDDHDFLRGNEGNDELYGGDGDDYLNGNSGDDLLDGGAGYDRATFYTGATTGVTVDLNIAGPQATGQGNDTLVGIENVSGTAYNDVLTGDAGDNWLWGSTSRDEDGVVTGLNNDTLSGGGGDDLLTVGAGDHLLAGGDGNDTVRFSENGGPETGVTISLGLQGSAQVTGNGSWTLTGIENLSGGTADDALTGDGADNILAGEGGNDSLSGGSGNDELYGDGSINADTHGLGYSGPIGLTSDNLAGGNDLLEGGEGDDYLDGGEGSDTASYANAAGGVQAQLYGGGFGEAFGADGYDQLYFIENLKGSAYDDLLFGDDDANVLDGGDGHDGLRGFGGDDTLFGGNGDDFLNGGEGDDTIVGGAGIDRASYYTDATAGVTVDLNLQGVAQNTGQGMDTLTGIENVSGTQFNDTLTGDEGDNVLWGSPATLPDGTISAANNDTLTGNGGNDLLIAGIGHHVLSGGSGTDTVGFTENGAAEPGLTISLELQGVAQATGAGNWTLTGIENLSGSLVNDSLTGDGNNNVLAGNSGNDILAGGAGNDTLYGDGLINWDSHGTGGSGPITTWTDVAAIGGVSGNDTLEGGVGDDQIYGGGGTDTASYANAGGSVEVFLYEGGFGEAIGADGYDQLFDIEDLTGSAFGDTLFGNSQGNMLSGGDGHDFLQARGGDDSVYGGNGDDYLGGGTGDDLLDGGAGFDRASFSNGSTGPVTVDLRIQGLAQNTGLGMDTLVDIEAASGTAFGDTITGNNGDNWLWGASDGTGDDTLDGQEGNDLIENGAGNHVIIGGDGVDTFRYSAFTSTSGIALSLALQGAPQNTGVGMMTLTGIENLSGAQFDDLLTGDGGANLLAGSGGNDTLVGGAGNDTLYGDGLIAPDTHGGGGSGPITTYVDVATIGGVSGNDLLEGGLGDDVIDGGGGVDTATYANASGGVNVNLGSGFAFGADGNDTLANIENLIGSEFSDTLNGSAADNEIQGLGGNDVIQGQGGNDTIYGGEGDDTLRGDAGELSLTVSGDDVIYGGNGNDGLRGGLGNDQLYGGANNDLLRGNGGVDYFDGGTDDGEGINGIGDRVSFFEQRATQGVVADLRTGIISNDGFGNVETMVGIESLGADTAYADTFHGDDSRNALFGNRGDSLYGHGGDDAIQLSSATAITDGGAGTDRLVLSSIGGWLIPDADADGLAEAAADPTAGWVVDLGAGSLLDGYGNSGSVVGIEIVDGTIFADTLSGDANANTLNGSDGNDVLNGRGGDDVLDGGNGIDTASYADAAGSVTVVLTGTGGSSSGAAGIDSLTSIENVTGSAFDDTLFGDAGVNLIQAGGGHDVVRGGGGNDTLEGGDGDDFLRGDDGDDIIRGGNGFDRAGFASSPVGVTVNLNIAGPQATGQGNDTFEGIEHVSGTQFNDVLTGNGGDNWLWGGSNGAGVTGNDVINGGGGNDLIEVGAGTHTLNGGAGTGDTLSLFGNGSDISSAGITYSLALQGSAQNTEQGMMNTSGFENVSGSVHADTIIGNSGANTLAGDLGNDTLRGEDGNDILYGDGRTLVDTHGIGGSGPITTWSDISTLTGDPGGNDVMLGGRGNDQLYGGRGNDTMTGNQGNDRFVIEAGGSGNDTVTDFAVDADKIVFSGVAGVDDFSDLTLTKVGNNTVISWGTSDSITLTGIKTSLLDSGDFEFAGAASFAMAATEPGPNGQSFQPDDIWQDDLAVSIASNALI